METEFGGGRRFVCFGAGADVCANDAGSIASTSKTENHRLFIFTPVAVNNTRGKKIFTDVRESTHQVRTVKDYPKCTPLASGPR